MRKKKKFDDTSRASTPLISVPKRINDLFLQSLNTTAQKKQALKKPAPALQVLPTPPIPTYKPIDFASVPPPRKPILDRDYVAAENLDFQNIPDSEIKQCLGVSAYPTVDLTKDLPGIPPSDDFSKAKAQNQITHDNFIKSIDPYFQAFTEEDLIFLRQRVSF